MDDKTHYVPSDSDLREALAAYAHEAWSGWMRYMFSKCFSNDAGELTIPAWAVARWTRQACTTYWDLPLGEPDSDRAEADKILEIFKKHRAAIAEAMADAAEDDYSR